MKLEECRCNKCRKFIALKLYHKLDFDELCSCPDLNEPEWKCYSKIGGDV